MSPLARLIFCACALHVGWIWQARAREKIDFNLQVTHRVRHTRVHVVEPTVALPHAGGLGLEHLALAHLGAAGAAFAGVTPGATTALCLWRRNLPDVWFCWRKPLYIRWFLFSSPVIQVQ